jgi:hypothetical protein
LKKKNFSAGLFEEDPVWYYSYCIELIGEQQLICKENNEGNNRILYFLKLQTQSLQVGG